MAKTLFDHLNHIHEKQTIDYFDNLSEEDRKTFKDYMICRLVSMNPDYVPVVNEIQKVWNAVGSRELYLFLSQLLPRQREYNKYIKAVKEDKYEEWVIDILRKYYRVSVAEAKDYAAILYENADGKAYLHELLVRHGVDPKDIKKAHI